MAWWHKPIEPEFKKTFDETKWLMKTNKHLISRLADFEERYNSYVEGYCKLQEKYTYMDHDRDRAWDNLEASRKNVEKLLESNRAYRKEIIELKIKIEELEAK